MGRNPVVSLPGVRRRLLLAVLMVTFAACAESESTTSDLAFPRLMSTPYSSGEEFELTVDQGPSWKGRIIGLVDLPRLYYAGLYQSELYQPDPFAAVSSEDAAEVPEGRCIALLGELTLLREPSYPDLLDLPKFELPDLQGGGALGTPMDKCDVAEVLAAGYGLLGFAALLSADESFPFFLPYYIKEEIPRSVAVSVGSWYEETSTGLLEASILSSVPRVTMADFQGGDLFGGGGSDAGEFSYTETWGTDTLTWSGRIEGIIEIDVPSDAFLIETAEEWVRPSSRCLAVVGSAALSHVEAEMPEWLEWNLLMAWPDIGLVVDGRVIRGNSISNFQCSPYVYPYIVDPNLFDRLLSTFLLPPDAEVEGVVVDPSGDETAFYEAIFLDDSTSPGQRS